MESILATSSVSSEPLDGVFMPLPLLSMDSVESSLLWRDFLPLLLTMESLESCLSGCGVFLPLLLASDVFESRCCGLLGTSLSCSTSSAGTVSIELFELFLTLRVNFSNWMLTSEGVATAVSISTST